MFLKSLSLSAEDTRRWDRYVAAHPHGTVYHLSGWLEVVRRTYGHRGYYLMVLESDGEAGSGKAELRTGTATGRGRAIREPVGEDLGEGSGGRVCGVLPMVQLKHPIFGHRLISIPYFDMGGVLADDERVEEALLSEAVKLAREVRAASVELRHLWPLACLRAGSGAILDGGISQHGWVTHTRAHKVRMVVELPDSPETLFKSFPSKLRSQIRRPLKEGLTSKIGGAELLDDFYDVFAVNMRDLGSPVHSKRLMANVLHEFPEEAALILVYRENEPVAGSLVIGFGDTLENPWASALRRYSRLSPNMLLYWSMLEFACNQGYRAFDFGRSTPGEGTFKFKEQWGAVPTPFHWHTLSRAGERPPVNESDRARFAKTVEYWQRLPVWLTRIIGPLIRKHIGL